MRTRKQPSVAPSDEETSERTRAEDAVLARRALDGDGGAFDELCRRHYGAIHATAYRLAGNADDAEDLAQECFVRAHRSLQWYRAEGTFGTWLRKILLHLARDRFRRQARRPRESGLDHVEPTAKGGPYAELGRRELERLLREALAGLPDRLRIPLVLRTLEGSTYEEIADLTGITPATARTQVMRARRRLDRLLRPYLGDEE